MSMFPKEEEESLMIGVRSLSSLGMIEAPKDKKFTTQQIEKPLLIEM